MASPNVATRGVSRSDDECPVCGSEMREAHGRLRMPVNGEDISVPNVVHLKCLKCREVVLTLQQARRFNQDAIAVYQKKHALLSAHEIRALRERLRLTQNELAKLLHLGANTISRWEAGRNAQTASMDVLLCLIRDMPGSISYLRKRAA
jgi:putative zinc finger/helix-turn-helix YgiT family protein